MANIKVNIKKPMYGNHVYINAKTVERAIQLRVKLEITVPDGTAIVDPLEWKNKNDWMKKVFLYPDRPMLMYGGNVPVGGHEAMIKKMEEVKKKKQNTLF
jgi:hypothetical protein